MKEIKEGYKITELGEIPNEWQIKSLKEVTEIVSGGTPDTKNNDYWEDGQILWATPTDITSNGKYIYDTLNKITEEGLKNSSANMLPVGAILMTSRATIGERCITKVPIATNQGFKSFICKEDLNNEFLYYLLGECQKDFLALAAGSTFVEISKSAVEKYKCILPTLPEQQKIADILSTVDEQIDNVDRLIEKTKELKKGLMQQLLTKGIGHTEFKETEVGVIPKEWEVKKLVQCSIGKPQYGIGAAAVEYRDDLPRYLRITDIDEEGNFISDNNACVDHKDSDNYILTVGDIVFARTGNSVGKNYLYNKADGKLVYAGFLIKFSIDETVAESTYIKKCCETKRFWNWVKVMSTRSGQPGINAEEYSNFLIPVPPLNEQKEIAQILCNQDALIQQYTIRKQKLQQLKKGLMQQLLTGTIRVKVDEV